MAGSDGLSDGMKVRAARGVGPVRRRRRRRATPPPERTEDPPPMWLTRLALRNPVLILMMSLMTIVLGFVSLRRLSVDLFPDINVPVIRVATFYTGAGPADIEKTITQPIERAVGASPGRRPRREPVAPGRSRRSASGSTTASTSTTRSSRCRSAWRRS